MKGEKPKTTESCPRKNSSESERYEGAPTLIGIVGDELVEVQLSSDRMLEYILTPDNLNRAYKQVKTNKGSGGIDRMEVEQLLSYMRHGLCGANHNRVPPTRCPAPPAQDSPGLFRSKHITRMLRHHKSVVFFQIEHSKTFLAAKLHNIPPATRPISDVYAFSVSMEWKFFCNKNVNDFCFTLSKKLYS